MNCLSILGSFFLISNALAFPVEHYTIMLENGMTCGNLKIEHRTKNTQIVDYYCIENGRGDRLKEKFKTSPQNFLTRYKVSGNTEMGAEANEIFLRKNKYSQWKSAAEKGRVKTNGHAFYLPMNSTFAITSLLISALIKSPNHSLELLPSGKITLTKLDEMLVANKKDTIKIQLLMLNGAGLNPEFYWVTTGKNPQLFAFISQGYSVFLDQWESSIAPLKEKQSEITFEILEKRATEALHPIKGNLVIKNIAIFNSEKALITEPHDIFIKDGKITQIISSTNSNVDSENMIDGTGLTAIPGLFDMHAHLTYWTGALHIANGVTTVRDMGNVNHHIQRMIELSKKNKLITPSIIPAGLIEGKSEYSNTDGILIDNLNEAMEAVDYYYDHDYRHIKIYSSFPKIFLPELVNYAHSKGMTIGGHIPAFMTATEAIEAGFDEINHINQLLLQFVSSPSSDSRTLERFYLPAENFANLDLQSPEITNLIILLKKNNITIDPTLTGFDFLKHKDGEIAEPFASISAHLPPVMQRELKYGAMKIPDKKTAERYQKSYQKMVEFTGLLYRSGVQIVAGTDAFPGFALHSELDLYVKAGITPAQALKIATYDAAKLTNTLHEKGSIEEGKLADIILVRGDPTKSIMNVHHPELVMTRGLIIQPNEIFEMIGIKSFNTNIKLH